MGFRGCWQTGMSHTLEAAAVLRLCSLPTAVSRTLPNRAKSLTPTLMKGGSNEEIVLLFPSSTEPSSPGCSWTAGAAQDGLTDPGIPVIRFIAIFQT